MDDDTVAYISASQFKHGIGREFVYDLYRASGCSDADLGIVESMSDFVEIEDIPVSDDALVVFSEYPDEDEDSVSKLATEYIPRNTNSEDDMLALIDAKNNEAAIAAAAKENRIMTIARNTRTPRPFDASKDIAAAAKALAKMDETKRTLAAQILTLLARKVGEVVGVPVDLTFEDLMVKDEAYCLTEILKNLGQEALDNMRSLPCDATPAERSECWADYNLARDLMDEAIYKTANTRPFNASKDANNIVALISTTGDNRPAVITALCDGNQEMAEAMSQSPKAEHKAICTVLAPHGEAALRTIALLNWAKRLFKRPVAQDEKSTAFSTYNTVRDAMRERMIAVATPLHDAGVDTLVEQVREGTRDAAETDSALEAEAKFLIVVDEQHVAAVKNPNAWVNKQGIYDTALNPFRSEMRRLEYEANRQQLVEVNKSAVDDLLAKVLGTNKSTE
ncbi:hypothetical protein KJ910_03855 [Patescibacteria group bacterium]|nr:hypothetical protein [Patescibacteria group bacterium]MBU1906983.1 hypothetical protein [Patescibacteria group bacterium]